MSTDTISPKTTTNNFTYISPHSTSTHPAPPPPTHPLNHKQTLRTESMSLDSPADPETPATPSKGAMCASKSARQSPETHTVVICIPVSSPTKLYNFSEILSHFFLYVFGESAVLCSFCSIWYASLIFCLI